MPVRHTESASEYNNIRNSIRRPRPKAANPNSTHILPYPTLPYPTPDPPTSPGLPACCTHTYSPSPCPCLHPHLLAEPLPLPRPALPSPPASPRRVFTRGSLSVYSPGIAAPTRPPQPSPEPPLSSGRGPLLRVCPGRPDLDCGFQLLGQRLVHARLQVLPGQRLLVIWLRL